LTKDCSYVRNNLIGKRMEVKIRNTITMREKLNEREFKK
jgi:hypothetical protein